MCFFGFYFLLKKNNHSNVSLCLSHHSGWSSVLPQRLERRSAGIEHVRELRQPQLQIQLRRGCAPSAPLIAQTGMLASIPSARITMLEQRSLFEVVQKEGLGRQRPQHGCEQSVTRGLRGSIGRINSVDGHEAEYQQQSGQIGCPATLIRVHVESSCPDPGRSRFKSARVGG